MERLKPATGLKLVSRGNEFHAFTTRSLKKKPRRSVQNWFSSAVAWVGLLTTPRSPLFFTLSYNFLSCDPDSENVEQCAKCLNKDLLVKSSSSARTHTQTNTTGYSSSSVQYDTAGVRLYVYTRFKLPVSQFKLRRRSWII